MTQEFNTLHYAVLTKRKTAHAMITGWTEPSSALIALNHCGILCVIATVHHFLRPLLTDYSNRRQRFHRAYSGLSADHLNP